MNIHITWLTHVRTGPPPPPPPKKKKNRFAVIVRSQTTDSRWASGPDNWILTLVAEVHGVWNLATNYHVAYFLSFLQTSSLLQAPIQAGLAPDCVEETLYFTNIYFS